MHKGRVELFSDGVIAVIITILVLELRVPEGSDWESLRPLIPGFVSYLLTFVFLGIYWNNHHHLFQAVGRVNGAVLWANLHLLFWLSLTPFFTAWMGEHAFATTPVVAYGLALFMAGVAYNILERTLIAAQGADSPLQMAIGHEIKGWVSVAVYFSGITASLLWQPVVGLLCYAAVALMWLIPDRRIERALSRG